MSTSSVQLIRHATLLIEMGGKKMLLDPMFMPKDSFGPIPNSSNDIKNPMVDLPLNQEALGKLVQDIDAVFVTHSHPDHWDPVAQQMIPKDKPVFCQAPDEEAIKEQGFQQVQVIADQVTWEGITIHRFGGVHGKGELAVAMGPVSGFVFVQGEDSIYVAGDTIWHEEVVRALATLKPKMTVLNAGGAQFVEGEPITMVPSEIIRVKEQAPETKVVAVHMDSINHCLVSREDLLFALGAKGMEGKIEIPADGEVVLL